MQVAMSLCNKDYSVMTVISVSKVLKAHLVLSLVKLTGSSPAECHSGFIASPSDHIYVISIPPYELNIATVWVPGLPALPRRCKHTLGFVSISRTGA